MKLNECCQRYDHRIYTYTHRKNVSKHRKSDKLLDFTYWKILIFEVLLYFCSCTNVKFEGKVTTYLFFAVLLLPVFFAVEDFDCHVQNPALCYFPALVYAVPSRFWSDQLFLPGLLNCVWECSGTGCTHVEIHWQYRKPAGGILLISSILQWKWYFEALLFLASTLAKTQKSNCLQYAEKMC